MWDQALTVSNMLKLDTELQRLLDAMSNLTNPPLRNPELQDKIAQTHPGMAHWAGTGPHNQYCGNCQNFTGTGWQPGRCTKFNKMLRSKGRASRLPPFPGKTPACLYFEAK